MSDLRGPSNRGEHDAAPVAGLAERDRLREAQMETRKMLVALRLELPDAVWQDVNRKVAALWDAAWDAVNAPRVREP